MMKSNVYSEKNVPECNKKGRLEMQQIQNNCYGFRAYLATAGIYAYAMPIIF